MDIRISNADPRPIYEQVCQQIKQAILSGALREGDALPSIRALAKDLRISVITTRRAYEELERDGYVHTVAGKGCYVAPKDTELVREQHLREIESHMRQIHGLAAPLGLTEAELLDMYHAVTEEESTP